VLQVGRFRFNAATTATYARGIYAFFGLLAPFEVGLGPDPVMADRLLGHM
jgi:hypothetical protein